MSGYHRTKLLAAVVAAFVAAPIAASANPSPPARYTGAPGDGLCTQCHSGTANSGPGRVSIAFPAGLTYTPGATQRLTVTVADPDLAKWAFQLTARLASNPSGSQGGTFTAINTLTRVLTSSPVQFIQTSSTGNQQGVTGSATYQVDWTAPATNVGNVVFYIAGMAASGSGTGGDRVYTANFTMTPASTPTPPTITASPASLAFNYVTGGTAPAAQNVSVSSSGTNVSFTAAASGGSWLSVTPTSSTTPRALSVAVNPAGLAVGTYSGALTIASTGASNSPQTVPISLRVSAATTPSLAVTPTSLSYAYEIGGTAPAAKSVSVASSGTNVSFTAAVSGGAWLSVSPTSGTTPAAVSVSANPAGLTAGTYNGALTIASAGATNSPQTVPVSLTVTTTTPPPPPPPPPVTSGSFRFNVTRVTNGRPGMYPKVTFSVTDPTNDNEPYDLDTHPAFLSTANGASRLFVQIGWDTRDYTNTGSGSEFASPAAAAQPIAINVLTPNRINNGDGTYTVVSPQIVPIFAHGTGVAALEGHPAGQDATGAWTVRVPVKSVFRTFIITGDTRVERRRVVDNRSCKACHGVLTLHGNNRTDEVQVCVICHNPNATDVPYRRISHGPEAPLDFKVMIHSIHAAQKRTTPYIVIGRAGSVNDFSHVQFPGDLRDCRTCHREDTYLLPLRSRLGTTIDTRSTLTLAAPIVNGDPDDDVKVTAAAATCSACHDTDAARAHMVANGASFATSQHMINSGAVNERCASCHGAGREKDVERVHRIDHDEEDDHDND